MTRRKSRHRASNIQWPGTESSVVDEPSSSRSRPRVSGAPSTSPRKRKRPQSSSRKQRLMKASFEQEGRKREVKKRTYYKKVVYDGGEFAIGDDVYVKRRDDASSEGEDPEVEECRICFKSGKRLMIECDDCLGGFHLRCLKPPLKEVPEGDWVCRFCEDRRLGKQMELPKLPEGIKQRRTAREKLLSSDLWAARIESIWKETDGTYWFRGRWYIIPEETAAGRQPHNLRREVYSTNDFADVEMESVLRHCFVMNPKEFSKASNEGDDVFLCEYEYDVKWHSFKRLADLDKEENDREVDSDGGKDSSKDSGYDTEKESEYENETEMGLSSTKSSTNKHQSHELAANSRKGRIFGLQKIGTKAIPGHVRCNKKNELERAKATLLLATLPKTLPCRNREMDEITAFVKGAVCEANCLGRCLYIHGVPGTGKTMSVLAAMKHLRSEVDAGRLRPYCFVEINGLKLASPENIYRVIYEALSGHRVGWKKALNLLNERFSEDRGGKYENQPCVLLIDELDLLVTRNQSEIISSRLKGIDAFENQAIEFASRKVAAISGDARRALEICRRAAELADYQIKQSSQLVTKSAAAQDSPIGKQIVGMSEVEAAIQEMFQAPHIQVMKSCSKLSKIVLVAMVHELYKTGMGETTFEKVATIDDVAFALKDCRSTADKRSAEQNKAFASASKIALLSDSRIGCFGLWGCGAAVLLNSLDGFGVEEQGGTHADTPSASLPKDLGPCQDGACKSLTVSVNRLMVSICYEAYFGVGDLVFSVAYSTVTDAAKALSMDHVMRLADHGSSRPTLPYKT
ncbi:Origin recognition complex, subunit 1 [Asimina triloba]